MAALFAILGVTVLWWAFALWPTSPDTSGFLLRAREVCFGKTETGLPDASGWLLLIGQPIGMVAVLAVGWREALSGGIQKLVATSHGRTIAVTTGFALVVCVGAASMRVNDALASARFEIDSGMLTTVSQQLDRPSPGFSLVDQHGQVRSQDDFHERPTMLAFAFSHCETLCPIVVDVAKKAQARLGEGDPVRIAVITVDPWRDTPARLPAIQVQWGLDDAAMILSGSVDEVNEVLDRFGVARQRDLKTGDVTHPGRILLIDSDGRLRYASPPDVARLVELVGGL